MIKRIFIVVLTVSVLLAIAIGALWYFGSKSVTSAVMGREIPETVVFGKNSFPVTSEISLQQHATCPEGTAPLDLVILIDVSGSMAGQPIEQAMIGAERLLDTLDFSKDQVAVATFDQDIVAWNGLTDNKGQLVTFLQSAAPIGGTDLNNALNFAAREFLSIRRRFDAVPVLVMFSDGGDRNRETIRQTADQLKLDGTQVFVIGLHSDDFDEDLLSTIASDLDSVQIAPTPVELVGLFEEIARSVGNYVITNLKYVEPVAIDTFEVAVSALPDGFSLVNDDLIYEAGVLTEREAADLAEFQYTVTPTRFGYHDVTSREAELVFRACGVTDVQETLGQGPSLLVLPPLPIVAAIPLALLLLALLPFLFRRSSANRPPRPLEPGPTSDPSNLPPLRGFAAWFDDAESLEAESGGTAGVAITSTQTLIVGLGSSGRTVLSQISQDLDDRFGDTWPDTVQLLQISLPGATTPLSGQATEVILQREIGRLDLERPHLQWARENPQGERQKGRQALFIDLADGRDNSIIWDPLGRVLANRRNMAIWIVSDAFGPASGLIADVAHLLRVRARSGIISAIRLCLAMQNARWPSERATGGVAEKCYATVRELQRLRTTNEARFVYAPGLGQQELEATSSGKLFDEVYLFDGLGESTEHAAYDISTLAPEDGVLKVIGNSLLALLEPTMSQAFYERERNVQSEVVRSGGGDIENYGSTMGCATIRTPIDETRRLTELHLVHMALFDPRSGLLGWGTLSDSGHQAALADVSARVNDIDVDELSRITGIDAAAAMSNQQVLERLTAYLTDRMNDGNPLRLRWALGLLDKLVERGIRRESIDHMRVQMRGWLSLVDAASPDAASSRQQGGRPGTSFLDMAAPNRQPDAARGDEKPRTLPAMWRRRWDAARDAFPDPPEDGPEQIAWPLEQEQALFRQYFDDQGATVDRLRRRVFWTWSRGDKPELRLLILPNSSDTSTVADGRRVSVADLRANPYAFALTSDQTQDLLDQMMAAARPFSRVLGDISISDYLGDSRLKQRLIHNASPLFRSKAAGSDTVAAQVYRYLLKPSDAPISGREIGSDTMVVNSHDAGLCLLFQAHHLIRLANMTSYVDARGAYRPDAGHHVFEAEQEAAEREESASDYGERFDSPLVLSPPTVALLESDSDVFDLLGKLLGVGQIAIEEQGESWFVTTKASELSFLATLPAADVVHAFVAQLRTNKHLRESLIGLLKEEPSAGEQRTNPRMVIDTLADSAHPGERDLAICIAWGLERQ